MTLIEVSLLALDWDTSASEGDVTFTLSQQLRYWSRTTHAGSLT